MQESLETILSINNVRVKAHHGWYPSERKIGGMYSISVRIFSKCEGSQSFDDIEDTINYEHIYNVITTVMKREYQLIETCCKALWDELKPMSQGDIWEVTIEKEDVPIKHVGSTSFVVKG